MLLKFKRVLNPQPSAQGVNPYWRQLSSADIAAGQHRAFVGGMWEEVGRLQLEFMKQQGLRPEHRLVDIGCGALRGGIHFVRYLHEGNYCGVDLNSSLIEAGKRELASAGLSHKRPHLLVNDKFEASRFGATFDYAIAVSVFTHVYMNHIVRCLVETLRVLKPEGKFYATFFEAPHAAHINQITHRRGGITTNYDADPLHYSFSEMEALASGAGISVELIGEWQHPRDQQMLCFTHR